MLAADDEFTVFDQRLKLSKRIRNDAFDLFSDDLVSVTDWAWMRALPPDVLPLRWNDLVGVIRPHSEVEERASLYIDEVSPTFRRRMEGAVEHAWRLLNEPSPPASAAFHQQAARLLLAQPAVRARQPEKPRRSPPAVAFVTSLSMELDLALMSAHCPRFLVVLPVTVTPGASQRSRLCWLGAVVEASGGGADGCAAPFQTEVDLGGSPASGAYYGSD